MGYRATTNPSAFQLVNDDLGGAGGGGLGPPTNPFNRPGIELSFGGGNSGTDFKPSNIGDIPRPGFIQPQQSNLLNFLQVKLD